MRVIVLCCCRLFCSALELVPGIPHLVSIPWSGNAGTLHINIKVPAEAPALQACAVQRSRMGAWLQYDLPALSPGSHTLQIDLQAVGWYDPLNQRSASPWQLGLANALGLQLWSPGPLTLDNPELQATLAPPESAPRRRLILDQLPGLGADGQLHLQQGERWECSINVDPNPAQPFDPLDLAIDLEAEHANGSKERIAAFWDEPARVEHLGDQEVVTPTGPARFLVRWRPQQAGTWQLRLCHGEERLALPPAQVAAGQAAPLVRIDPQDPRFLSTHTGTFYWPNGLTISSVHDKRCSQRLGTVVTPDVGVASYEAYFARLAASGGDCAEVWLSTWGFALEWTPERPYFFGLTRYNLRNATRLDALLDTAWRYGIRLILTLHNHGQALEGNAEESEWAQNPLNAANGGPCTEPEGVFYVPEALKAQHALRRYLAGRYADHPAVLAWMLWSEVDLTRLGIRVIRQGGSGMDTLRTWHELAAADWKRLDPYGHIITTHVASSYEMADHRLMSAPGIDLISLDAYHQQAKHHHTPLYADFLAEALEHRRQGLARLGKAVLVTEHGASEEGGQQKLRFDHTTAGWSALVAGHAGAPMLWWAEWVDQNNVWAPYGALRNFLRGEDLRGKDARSARLSEVTGNNLWCRAWVRPGRALIYVQDRAWALSGGVQQRAIEDAQIRLSAQAAPGTVVLQVFDANSGDLREEQRWQHSGGALDLALPAFMGHLALKVWRE